MATRGIHCLPPWGTAQLWHMDLDAFDASAEAEAALAGFERERVGRLRFASDRRRYLAAHWGLRVVLARAIGCAAAEVKLVEDEHGKPRTQSAGPQFSLSHSDRHAVVALDAGHAVGVDIEVRRPLPDAEGLAGAILSDSEHAQWQRLPAPARVEALLVAWTRKEAALKAIGIGLKWSPQGVESGLGAHPHRWPLPAACAPGRVQWAPTRPQAEYVLSLAWHEPEPARA